MASEDIKNEEVDNKTENNQVSTDDNKTDDSKNISLFADENTKTVSVCDIDLDQILISLHFNATKKASAKNSDIQITNSAIDGKDKKSAKFTGAGSNIIAATVTKEDQLITVDEALPVIQEYVQWFAGPDIVSKITTDKIYIIPGSETSNTEQENKTEEKQNEESSSAENTEKSNEQNNESIHIPSFSTYLLNEAAEDEASEKSNEDSESSEENAESSDTKSDSSDTAPEKDKTQKTDTNNTESQKAKGWCITYNLIVKGRPEHKIADAFKMIGKSLGKTLGNIFKNLGVSSFDWRSGSAGEVHTIGDVVDSLDKVFGKINPDELQSNFNSELKNKFPQSNAQSVIIDSQTIIKNLNKRLDGKAKSAIKAVDLAICVKVDKSDKSYKLFNQQSIADLVNASIKGLFKKLKHGISSKDVILVNNYSEDANNNEKIDIDNEEKESKQKEEVNSSQINNISGKLIIENTLKTYLADDIVDVEYLSENYIANNIMSMLFEENTAVTEKEEKTSETTDEKSSDETTEKSSENTDDEDIKKQDNSKYKNIAIPRIIENLQKIRSNLDEFIKQTFVNKDGKPLAYANKENKNYAKSGFKPFYEILADADLSEKDTEVKLNNLNDNNIVWKKLANTPIDKILAKTASTEEDNKDSKNSEENQENTDDNNVNTGLDFYIVPMKGLKKGGAKQDSE